MSNAWIDARQIEAARRVIVQTLQRGGKVWIRLFPAKPVSAKPVEVRMGKGKGATDRWVSVVKRGRVMFEIAGVETPYRSKATWFFRKRLTFSNHLKSKWQVSDSPILAN